MAAGRKQTTATASDRGRGPGRGRRARKLPEAIRAKVTELERSLDDNGLPRTDEEFARALRGDTGWRTYPHPEGKKWTTATARSARSAVRQERIEFLRRCDFVLRPLIEDLDGLSRPDFVRLGKDVGVEPYWLRDRFDDPQFFPVLERPDEVAGLKLIEYDEATARVVATDRARQILRSWDLIRVIVPEGERDWPALDIARIVGTGKVDSRAAFETVCRRYHVPVLEAAALPFFKIKKDSVELTPEANEAALQWDIHLYDWSGDYWPASGEEAAMPANWDWDLRPYEPRSVTKEALKMFKDTAAPRSLATFEAAQLDGEAGLALEDLPAALSLKSDRQLGPILERLKSDLNKVYSKYCDVPDIVWTNVDNDGVERMYALVR